MQAKAQHEFSAKAVLRSKAEKNFLKSEGPTICSHKQNYDEVSYRCLQIEETLFFRVWPVHYTVSLERHM